MTTNRTTEAPETSLAGDVVYALRYYLRGWRGPVALAVVALAGLGFSWSWLVAAGLAPLLLTALPCVAMCGLGLCMTRMGDRSCSTGSAPRSPARPRMAASRHAGTSPSE